MAIHDELILELIKPNRLGEVGEGALVINVVGNKNLKYSLEEPQDYQTRDDAVNRRWSVMTPDITITIPIEKREIAIELENDVHWDFGHSLRQVKKYKARFGDVRVIIPEDYKRFASLYRNEGFRVYLWRAVRKWECLRCGTVTDKKGPVQPKCKNKKCGNTSRNEFRLVGLKDADVEEFI